MPDNVLRPDFSSSYNKREENVQNRNNVTRISRQYYDPNKELFDMVNNKRKTNQRNMEQSSNRQQVRRTPKKQKRKIRNRAAGLLLGITIGIGAITSTALIANQIRNNHNEAEKDQALQQAIMQAREDDGWFEQSFIFSMSRVEDMNKLEAAIARYGEFKDNPSLKESERESYIKTCNEILGNAGFISSQYTQAIEEEVARLYGLEEKTDVKVSYIISKDDGSGSRIYFTKDGKKTFISENPSIGEKKMSEELTQAIKDARCAKDIEADRNLEVDTDAVEDVIRAYGSMEKFSKADISLDDSGNIVVKYNNEKQESNLMQNVENNKELDDERE